MLKHSTLAYGLHTPVCFTVRDMARMTESDEVIARNSTDDDDVDRDRVFAALWKRFSSADSG